MTDMKNQSKNPPAKFIIRKSDRKLRKLSDHVKNLKEKGVIA